MQWFSRIDLKDGYHQIPLSEKSREMTAFTTHFGKFQFRKMPIGLTNAPAIFQEKIYAALGEYIGKFCFAYMDNVLIVSKTLAEHYKHVEIILSVLAGRKLEINFRKSLFAQQGIAFLGYDIREDKM